MHFDEIGSQQSVAFLEHQPARNAPEPTEPKAPEISRSRTENWIPLCPHVLTGPTPSFCELLEWVNVARCARGSVELHPPKSGESSRDWYTNRLDHSPAEGKPGVLALLAPTVY
jgi:hypothetical protein